jgi:hypothetical protein
MENNKILKDFEKYLIDSGYSAVTPSGNLSTVYDYQKRILSVSKLENLETLDELALKINKIVMKYDIGGENEVIGNKSHRAVINALKKFKSFINDKNQKEINKIQ